MAYSTSRPASLIHAAGIGNSFPQTWALDGTDAATVVRVNGYISNAKALGMKVGDKLRYRDTDASPPTFHEFVVSAINANGSADLSDGTATPSVVNTD